MEMSSELIEKRQHGRLIAEGSLELVDRLRLTGGVWQWKELAVDEFLDELLTLRLHVRHRLKKGAGGHLRLYSR
jgi:hypothetical protein